MTAQEELQMFTVWLKNGDVVAVWGREVLIKATGLSVLGDNEYAEKIVAWWPREDVEQVLANNVATELSDELRILTAGNVGPVGKKSPDATLEINLDPSLDIDELSQSLSDINLDPRDFRRPVRVGDLVLYRIRGSSEDSYVLRPALVLHVWSDVTVNLFVFYSETLDGAIPQEETSVPQAADDDEFTFGVWDHFENWQWNRS